CPTAGLSRVLRVLPASLRAVGARQRRPCCRLVAGAGRCRPGTPPLPPLEVTREAPEVPEKGPQSGKSFAAHFVEVRVHARTGEVHVVRVVSAIDAGRIMNPKTAQGQVYGAITWGLGLALMEDAVLDHRFGRITNADLANYHVPTNADIPTNIDVIFIDKPDMYLDPMGAKGLGEIGIVGFSAAIANAVFHATGKRVRELPITPDKLM
ncbi:MAG: xanthine dehydrogenase family protein molybdopterin-binding subunit, partial [Hymenobacter sp.]